MQVLGYEKASFYFNDGHSVSGSYLYLKVDEPNRIKNVVGMKTERIFLSDTKLANSNYTPKVGDNINVYYNRYGKVDSVQKVS